MTNFSLLKSIDRSLGRYLPLAKDKPKILHKAMRYSVFSGGKRIRPVIVLESCRACGGRSDGAMPAACSVELIHTYSLIHDDLPSMDDDDYRRGKLTCHKVFGEANAILAGDALLTLAFNLAAERIAPKIASEVVKELSYAAGTHGMVGGQAADLEYKIKTKDPKGLDHINYLKTAKLFEVSAKIGAITAPANKIKIKNMADYGMNLGMAFQITDDIIDREGYAKALGCERSMRDAKIFVEKAKKALRIFGRKGERLREIADSVLKRAA